MSPNEALIRSELARMRADAKLVLGVASDVESSLNAGLLSDSSQADADRFAEDLARVSLGAKLAGLAAKQYLEGK